MKPKQVTNTLMGLSKLGLVAVEQAEPAPGTPAYIKHRNVYSLSPAGAAAMREFDRVQAAT